MSWDVVVMKFPENFNNDWDNVPKDFKPETICTHEHLKNEIKKLLPNINHDDPSWMVLNGETYSIEFNVGADDPINCIMLHVRGGDEALQAIKIFCEKFNCDALDTTEGKCIDFNEKSNKGFSAWRKYRDKVLNITNE